MGFCDVLRPSGLTGSRTSPSTVGADSDFGVGLAQACVDPGQVVLLRHGVDDIKVPPKQEGDFDLAAFGGGHMRPGVSWKAKPFTEERLWRMGIVLAAQELKLDLPKTEVDLEHGRGHFARRGGVERSIIVDAGGCFYIGVIWQSCG